MRKQSSFPTLGPRRRRPCLYPGLRAPLSGVVAAVLLGLAAQGCAVGPPYERPDAALPATFRGEAAGTPDSIVLGRMPWMEVFPDPTLQQLMTTALANNLDLLKRYRDLGAIRVSVSLPADKADAILPTLDRWAKLIQQVNG